MEQLPPEIKPEEQLPAALMQDENLPAASIQEVKSPPRGWIRRFFWKLGKWEYAFLCLMLITNLAIHFAIINNPPNVVFDEVYYVNEAKSIMVDHTDNRTEHPPLGKLLITASVATLGDRPLGWRGFSVLFSTANILLFYLICRALSLSVRTGNLAIFLLTFENLSFIQGGVAMLDVFSVTFTLLAFWLYLKQYYPFTGAGIALAALSKLTGVFSGLVIFMHWAIARRKETIYFGASMLLAPLVFLLLMPVLEFAIYHRLVDFLFSIKTMFTQSESLTFATVTHLEAIRPWVMVIQPHVMPYWYNPHIFAAISFTVWALIIPAFIYMIIRAVKKNNAAIFGVSWFTGTYLIWFPLTFITNRVMYLYYFYPAVGAVCLGIAMGLSQLIDVWKNRATGRRKWLRWLAFDSVVVFLVLHLAVFIVLAPINPWAIEKWIRPWPWN